LHEEARLCTGDLPRFNTGKHLFSTTFGERPANGFSKAKERIDEIVGDMPHWVIHDLRRTMPTNLSALPMADNVRELMIAHAQPGMHQVYDQYSYLEEKRAGFGLWNRPAPRYPCSVALGSLERRRCTDKTLGCGLSHWPCGVKPFFGSHSPPMQSRSRRSTMRREE
jgi:hypothetical protein